MIYFSDFSFHAVLCPFEFLALVCRMRHQRPYVSWPMSQRMECHIVWQPNLWKLKWLDYCSVVFIRLLQMPIERSEYDSFDDTKYWQTVVVVFCLFFFIFVFIETIRCSSMNVWFILFSKSNGNCLLTSLAWVMSTAHACKSHLFPTSTIGTSSASLTRFICSR